MMMDKRHCGKSHLQLKVNSLPETVLLPGDPARVLEIASYWDNAKEIGENREFKTMVGRYKGMEIAACSTGIGGASTEIAVAELFQLGARRLIRVGTAGGISPKVKPGDLVVLSGCVRYSGAADAYIPLNYPAIANYKTVMALIGACQELDCCYHEGLGLSLDSFYASKTHLIQGKSLPSRIEPLLNEWVKAGVLQLDMETATLFILASLLGIEAGAICTVGSNLFFDYPTTTISNGAAISAALLAALKLASA